MAARERIRARRARRGIGMRRPPARRALPPSAAVLLAAAAFFAGCRPDAAPREAPAGTALAGAGARRDDVPAAGAPDGATAAGERPASAPQAGTQPSAAGDAAELLARGARLADAERFVEAARLLRDGAAVLSPAERAEIDVAIARYYHRAGLWQTAAEHADRALAAGGESAEALFLAGDARRRQEDQTAAEPLLVRACAADPALLEATCALASLRRAKDGPEASLALLAPYFDELAPGTEPPRDAVLEYARAASAAGRAREAADRLVELLAREPFLTAAYADLAQAYFRLRLRPQGQLAQAIHAAFEKSAFEAYLVERMEKAGAVAFARTQRALNRMKDKRFLAAYDDLRAALAIDRSDARVVSQFAEFCLRFHRLREASAELAAALAAGAQPASGAQWMAARVFLERGLAAEALAASRAGSAALAREGDLGGFAKGQAPAYSLALVEARAALETGDFAAARASLERAAASEAGRWETEYWRGRVELASGDPKLALTHFGKAFGEESGKFTDLVLYNGIALERAGNVAEAISQFEQITRKDPSSLEAFDALLNILVLSGTEEDAAKAEDVEKRLAAVKVAAAGARDLRAAIDAAPALAPAADLYRQLGAARLLLGEAGAYDDLFLAVALAPADPVPLKLLLPGLRRPADSFLRLHYLEQLHRLEPENDAAVHALADLYVALRARLARARDLAALAHARASSAETFRLQAAVALAAGEEETGREWLRRGLEAFPESEPLLRLREHLEGSPAGAAGSESDTPPGDGSAAIPPR